MGWINKGQKVENVVVANDYNEYSNTVVQAYASNLSNLSEAQIRNILQQTNTIEDSEKE